MLKEKTRFKNVGKNELPAILDAAQKHGMPIMSVVVPKKGILLLVTSESEKTFRDACLAEDKRGSMKWGYSDEGDCDNSERWRP